VPDPLVKGVAETMHARTDPQPARVSKRRHRAARHPQKRTVLLSVVVILLAVTAVVLPQAQQRASAIDDGKDISWDMNGGSRAYNAMLEAVRQRATGGVVLREGILQTNPGSTEIFTVNVTHSGAPSSSSTPSSFRLIMRASDLFVLGWVIDGPSGQERVFFFSEEDTGYRGVDGDGELVPVPFSGSYGDLENAAGRTRTGLKLNGSSWLTVFVDMIETSVDETGQDAVARAMLALIPAVAEGARFDPIQQAVAPSFDAGEHVVTPAESALMNDWSKASKQLVDNLNNLTPIDFTVDDPLTPDVDFQATTVSGMALLLAIALITRL
jgi:hypothetical protein